MSCLYAAYCYLQRGHPSPEVLLVRLAEYHEHWPRRPIFGEKRGDRFPLSGPVVVNPKRNALPRYADVVKMFRGVAAAEDPDLN
jgi:hypothetical protein